MRMDVRVLPEDVPKAVAGAFMPLLQPSASTIPHVRKTVKSIQIEADLNLAALNAS
jgi:hypothetical protein